MRRQTTQRAAIVQVFHDDDRPLTIEEILRQGRQLVASLNQATVYRNLRLLIDRGWLTQIYHPSLGPLYERTDKGHHHHFHCLRCNRVFEIPGCPLNHQAAAPAGFIVREHQIFLAGTCPDCVRIAAQHDAP